MESLVRLKSGIFNNKIITEDIEICLNHILDNYDYKYATIFYKLLLMLKNDENLVKQVQRSLKIIDLIILPVKKCKILTWYKLKKIFTINKIKIFFNNQLIIKNLIYKIKIKFNIITK